MRRSGSENSDFSADYADERRYGGEIGIRIFYHEKPAYATAPAGRHETHEIGFVDLGWKPDPKLKTQPALRSPGEAGNPELNEVRPRISRMEHGWGYGNRIGILTADFTDGRR